MDLRQALAQALKVEHPPDEKYPEGLKRRGTHTSPSWANDPIQLKIPKDAQFVIDLEGQPALLWSIMQGEFGMVRLYLQKVPASLRGETVVCTITQSGLEAEVEAEVSGGREIETWNYLSLRRVDGPARYSLRVYPSGMYQKAIAEQWPFIAHLEHNEGTIFLKPL